MSRTRQHSLALVVAACTAAVIAGGMALYAVLQYFLTPGHTVLGLVFENSRHVVTSRAFSAAFGGARRTGSAGAF